MKRAIPILALLLLVCAARAPQKLTITSSAFRDGGTIPPQYTCDGGDVIPPIAIGGVPSTARSIALIVDDPDAPRGTWVHWVIWNIPAATAAIAEGKPPAGVEGQNSFGRTAWGGPCPPGGVHRYYWRVYALDTMLPLTSTATRADLDRAMSAHVVAEGVLMGRYARKQG